MTFTVRRRDILWMFIDSWVLWLYVVPMLLLDVLLLTRPDPGGTPGAIEFSVLILVGAPFAGLWLSARMLRWNWLVGRKVRLHIDGAGVTGWPRQPDLERTWSDVHFVRELHGVITLPFGGPWAYREVPGRAGWVLIPRRALNPAQSQYLRSVFAANGLTKESSTRMLRGHPGLRLTEAWLDEKLVIPRTPIRALLHQSPILVGDAGLKAPHPAYRWEQIASMDVDPRKPNELRLWLYDGTAGPAARDRFPSRVDLRGYRLRRSRVQGEIEAAFKAYQRSTAGPSSVPIPTADS